MQPTERKMTNPTRRTVLRAGVGVVAVPSLAAAAARPGRAERTLVMLHLAGGNDGLNTIIPYADPLYRTLRPQLSRAARGALPINGSLALHASLRGLYDLYQRGRVAVIQGVGYPDPDYSHVGSGRVWATGARHLTSERGWLDRVLEHVPARSPVRAVCLGAERSAMIAAALVTSVRVLDEAAPGRALARVAGLVTSTRPPELVFATLGGFDTHTEVSFGQRRSRRCQHQRHDAGFHQKRFHCLAPFAQANS